MSLSFIHAAREEPGRVALVAGGEPRTFSDLLPLVYGAMHHIHSLGLSPGDEKRPVRLVLPDSDDMTVAKLPRPRKVLKTITLRMRTWRENPTPKPGQRLVGIDNVQLLRPAAPKGGVFLDSVGGLVAFPRGTGGESGLIPPHWGESRNLTVAVCRNYTRVLTGQSILPSARLRPECLVTERNTRWVCGCVLPF